MVDASVPTVFYASDDPRRDAVVERLSVSDALVAPAHLDVEVVSALRGLALRHPRLRDVMPIALRHLASFSIRRLPLAPLLERIWELPDNVHALRRRLRRHSRAPRRNPWSPATASSPLPADRAAPSS